MTERWAAELKRDEGELRALLAATRLQAEREQLAHADQLPAGLGLYETRAVEQAWRLLDGCRCDRCRVGRVARRRDWWRRRRWPAAVLALGSIYLLVLAVLAGLLTLSNSPLSWWQIFTQLFLVVTGFIAVVLAIVGVGGGVIALLMFLFGDDD